MKLNTEIDFNLKRFFRWWGRELSYWVPEKIRQSLSDKSGYIYLSVTAEKLKFERIIDEKYQTVAEIAINTLRSEQFLQLKAKQADMEKATYVLRLTPEQAIKKTVYLPVVAKENLQQVIAFEMDKYTPFNTEQIYFSTKVLGKEENGLIKVLLVITPKEILDTIHQQLNNAQIYPDVIDYELAANNFADDLEPYNLLPETERPKKEKMTQLVIGLFSVGLFALVVAVLVFPVWQEAQTVDTLREQLKKLEKDSSAVQFRQLEIDEMVAETTRLIAAKNKVPAVTKLINKLSQLIPNDTWLNYYQYRDQRLQIKGQSPAASTLIEVLEASPLFSNARFVSPLTQDKKTGLERFQISVDVNQLGEADD